ncbi:MAG: hypothetical protein J5852_00115, partial [Clostridia bacterium]|nr:hypothetical protein [Clostridia bacterium]
MFRFKKLLAVVVSFLLLLSTFAGITYNVYGDIGDESTPRIVVQSVSGNPGETVDVKISFENNPGITSAKLLVSFPDDFTLTSVSFGDIGGQSLSSEKLVSPATLNWFNGISDLQTTEFVYATLTFKISNNATLTSNEISIDYNPNDLFNVNEVNVNFTKVNGSIVVFCDHTNTTLRNVLSPTCTQQGYSGDTYCLICGKKMADGEVISALGHDYQDVVTPPTCTAQGYTTHTCSRCSDSYVDTYTEPTGHNYGEWTVTTSPTCTEPGVETRVCSNDNKHIEMREIPALGHTGGKATCTNKAICERCSQEYGEIDPNYHPNANTVGYVAPTCTEPGQTGVFACPDCHITFTESQELSALGHNFTVYVSDNNATCTADGTKTAKCERCDA